MEEIQYIGEHLRFGQIGQLLIFLALTTGILAAIAYAKGSMEKNDLDRRQNWKIMGRGAFFVHAFSIFSVIGLIFYLMINRHYEYEYVWAHVSDDLPFRYIFSAFWEGQEGSFLLWMFWHAVLGIVLIFTAKKWEMPVLTMFAAVQVFLVTMILGIYFGEGDVRFGSSPFVLLRDMNASPAFNNANYLQNIEGSGLNPLLQNYWMTIHPPTLFLGFASTLVPFAFAFAGLWMNEHKSWLKPALQWSLFSAAILGTGIWMGGAWAYEALSFGGYWAWDPVENASFVPWLTLVAGVHTALIAKNTGHAIRSTYVFFFLTFILILYSTFLTRSGVLGDSSVHAFTEMGLEWQLVIFITVFTLIPFFYYFKKYKEVPAPKKEESTYSREFWMFVGSLILLFSAVLITYTTSAPVFNKILNQVELLFGWDADTFNIAPPKDPVEHHNKYQIWIGILIALMSGATLFFRYRSSKIKPNAWLHIGLAAIIAVGITVPVYMSAGLQRWTYGLLLWAGIYGILINADYVISILRGRLKLAGSATAHLGFAMMLVGFIFSGALKEPISIGFESINRSSLGSLNPQTDKSVLLVKGSPSPIQNNYWVTYERDSVEGNNQTVWLRFEERDPTGTEILNSFYTKPHVLRQELPMGGYKLQAANPSTKHYWYEDVFTLAVPEWAFEDPEKTAEKKAAELDWQSLDLQINDSLYVVGDTILRWSDEYLADTLTKKGRYLVVFDSLQTSITEHPDFNPADALVKAGASLQIQSLNTPMRTKALPVYYIEEDREFSPRHELKQLGLNFRFDKILPKEQLFKIAFAKTEPDVDFVVMQAIVFPGINLVWLGSVLLVGGFVLSLLYRLIALRNK